MYQGRQGCTLRPRLYFLSLDIRHILIMPQQLREVASILVSCGRHLQELRLFRLMRNARTTLCSSRHECLDKNLSTFDFGHFDVLIQGHFYLFGTCILRI